MDIARLMENTKQSASNTLTESEAKQVLREYGVPVVAETAATDRDAAIAAAKETGFPVALKGMGRTLTHKTERGLVHLGLPDADAVGRAADAIRKAAGDALEAYLVQPMVPGRREMVAGLFRDRQFGPVVMFGLGGVFAEALSDVTFRVAPVTESDAREMIGDLRSGRILADFRGEAAAETDALVRTLTGLSKLAEDFPEVAEVDINPLKITPEGDVRAVDALITVRDPSPADAPPPPVDPRRMGQFFHPRSIAFVGATSTFGKWGYTLLTITLARGYQGEVYLVNPKGGRIAGREVYRSVTEIPGPVDLAVVTIPAAGVMDLIPQFREKGIRNMLLITSGFGETGAEGKALEKELVETARAADILIVGPNTMGVCNPHISFYCTGSHVWPEPGDTAVVAQSGNMGSQLLAFAENQGIGIRGFSGSGNEAMVTIEDYLEAFETDPTTRNVMLYVESVKNGRRFFETARRMSKQKPIVLMKGGRTAEGSRAAATHTGALASDARIFDAVCRQAGLVTADYPMDLLDLSAAFSSLPLPRGSRAAIMTLGGGWGVVTADLCAEFDIRVPDLTPEIIARIDNILPPYWSKCNPVDIVGEHDPNIAVGVLKELMAWDGCDAVINLGLIGRKMLLGRFVDSATAADPDCSVDTLNSIKSMLENFERQYIDLIVELMEKHGKPVFGVSLAFDQEEKTVYQVSGRPYQGVVYPSPERAVKAFAKMVAYRRFLDKK